MAHSNERTLPEIRRARQQQHAVANPDTKPKTREILAKLDPEWPTTLQRLRDHGFPPYQDKLFPADQVEIDGRTWDVYKFQNGANFTFQPRMGTYVERGAPVLAIAFTQRRDGGAVQGRIVGTPQFLDMPYRIYEEKDLNQLRPDRVNAILEVLKGLQKEVVPPSWDVGEAPPLR